MATSIVTIDAPDKVVTCNSQGEAQQLFNVKNTCGYPLTIGAKVLVDGKTQAQWLTLDAPAEQDLGENVLTQIPVSIKVPADCPPGRYTYRLLVYSARKSGEEYTEGETVAIEVPEREVIKPVEPQVEKKFPWWIAALIAVVVIGGATWFFWPKSVEVPDVVGKPLADARTLLKGAGLGMADPDFQASADLPPDSVLAQAPAAGQEVDKGTLIKLTLAETPIVQVPSLKGFRLAAALQRLNASGLGLGDIKEQNDDSKPVGTVLDQSPGANAQVQTGTAVSLTVSKEPGKVLILDRDQIKLLQEMQPNTRLDIPTRLFRVAPQ